MTESHYTRDEWIRYRENSLPDPVRRRMEEHLAACDHCFEIYLSCIGDEEVELAEVFLPRDFAVRIADKSGKLRRTPVAYSPSGYLIALRNYAVAGVVTAVLLGCGWFSATPKAITTLFEPGQKKVALEERLPLWSRDLATKINKWIEKTLECTSRPSQ